jgi:hypothetical protein
MLLNTGVSHDRVHSLLGCVIRPSTASAVEHPRAKLLHDSLNLLLAAGRRAQTTCGASRAWRWSNFLF